MKTKKIYEELAALTRINRIQIAMYIFMATFFYYIVFYDLHTTGVLGQSMFPALQTGGIIVEIAPENLQRGDIITAYFQNILIVKRLIGLSGETIKFYGNSIYINDCLIQEYYIVNDSQYPVMEFEIGLDEVFIMGDNRDISYDSRNFGPIKVSNLNSKVIWNYKW